MTKEQRDFLLEELEIDEGRIDVKFMNGQIDRDEYLSYLAGIASERKSVIEEYNDTQNC